MSATPKGTQRQVLNYCVGFVDLLGQRDALKGQQIVKLPFESPEKEQEFVATLRKTIGAIYSLQEDSEEILRLALSDRDSPRRQSLTPEERAAFDEAGRTHLVSQGWSDGLLYFSRLGNAGVKCAMNGVFNLFGLLGNQMMLGLAESNRFGALST